ATTGRLRTEAARVASWAAAAPSPEQEAPCSPQACQAPRRARAGRLPRAVPGARPGLPACPAAVRATAVRATAVRATAVRARAGKPGRPASEAPRATPEWAAEDPEALAVRAALGVTAAAPVPVATPWPARVVAVPAAVRARAAAAPVAKPEALAAEREAAQRTKGRAPVAARPARS